jgi:hypothetical protein
VGLLLHQRPVVADDIDPVGAQNQLVAAVTPALGRRPVVAVAVELDNQRGRAEVSVDPDTVDRDVQLR